MMNRREDDNRLAQLDFDAAFPGTPEAVRDAVELAGANIRRFEQRAGERRRRYTLAVAAAAMVLAITSAVLALGHGRHDAVVPPPAVVAERPASLPETVYASLADPRYHSREDCPQAKGNIVALPGITAEAFDKQPCPECVGR